MAEELFLEKVDKGSTSSAWYCTEVLEVQKELGEAVKHNGFVSCHSGGVLTARLSKASRGDGWVFMGARCWDL